MSATISARFTPRATARVAHLHCLFVRANADPARCRTMVAARIYARSSGDVVIATLRRLGADCRNTTNQDQSCARHSAHGFVLFRGLARFLAVLPKAHRPISRTQLQ